MFLATREEFQIAKSFVSGYKCHLDLRGEGVPLLGEAGQGEGQEATAKEKRTVWTMDCILFLPLVQIRE